MDQYYSISEVAKNLKLSQKSIRRYIHSGQLRASKVGGVYRLSETEIKNFIFDKEKDQKKLIIKKIRIMLIG